MADGLRIRFDMPFGVTGINRELKRISDAADDMRPAWVEVVRLFVESNKRTFRAGQAGGWAPLSANYAGWKAKHYPGRPILVRSGDLYRSLTSDLEGAGGSAGSVLQLTPTRMVAGSTVDYGRYHQQGTGRMPARPPIAVTEFTRRQMVKAVQAHLMGSFTAGVTGPTGARVF